MKRFRGTSLLLILFGSLAGSSVGLLGCQPALDPADESPGGSPAGSKGGSGGQTSGSASGGSGGGNSANTGGTAGGTSSGGAPGSGGANPGSGGANPGSGGGEGGAAGGASGQPDAGPGTPPAAGAGGGSAPDPEQPATPAATDLTKHKHSKIIKLDTTTAGAGVMGAVTKYPVAVILNAQNFDFAQAKDKGEDIRFSKMDGALLPYNVESWDKDAKTASIWVKLDEVKGNDNAQSFVMHWGNPEAGSASNPKAVFDVADGFMGVWHLNEEGNEMPGGYRDSSGYEAHGTGVKLAPGSRVDGRIGKGTRLANSKADWKGQWVRVDGPKVETAYNVSDKPITVSIWAKAASFPGHSTIGGYETVFSKGDTSWTFQRFSLRNVWEACTKGPGNVTWHNCAISKANIATEKWFHFMLVITPANLTLYINGVREAATGNGKRNSPHPFGIGQQTQSLMGKREWDGVVDEARVMGAARDPNWAKLDYESQREGSTFMSFGPTQTK